MSLCTPEHEEPPPALTVIGAAHRRQLFRFSAKLFSCGIGCCSCLIAAVIALYCLVLKRLAELATALLVTIDDAAVRVYTDPELTSATLVHNIWWPGCNQVSKLSDFDTQCGEPCFVVKVMREMHAFNEEHPGQLLQYPSRHHEGIENVTLRGWWLPAPSGHPTAPRIVLQHGFAGNSNTYQPFFAAYLLRRLGFSVLLNNFRDHGYSDNSSAHIYEWGHSYPYDVLGAWDFVTRDPDGVLAGPTPPSNVGIMGFSKGAFTTLNAFGLEREVSAVWVDGSPFTPKVAWVHTAKKAFDSVKLPFLGPFFIDAVWAKVEDEALSRGVDLNKHLPENLLPRAPNTARPIYIVGNENDDTVPIGEWKLLSDLLESYPEKYKVDSWAATGTCNGHNHCVDHLRDIDGYSERLCKFWKPAFGMNVSSC